MATTRKAAPATLSDPVSPDLKQVLRTLKLGKMLDTLPERLTLARQRSMPHADFLELVLSDEITRRDTNSAALRARAAGLDPGMRLDTWGDAGGDAGRRRWGRDEPQPRPSAAETAMYAALARIT